MKRRNLLEKFLNKAGLTDDQIAKIFENLDDEHPDEDAARLLASLMTADEAKGNDTIFGDVKKKVKAESLDPIDTMLKAYEPKLTSEQKAVYQKFGPSDSHKKYQFILKAFDEIGTKTGDKNFDDLQNDYRELKAKIDSGEYVAKTAVDTERQATTAALQEVVNVKLLVNAIKNGKLRDVSNDRHFERNFVADAQELLNTGIGEKKLKGVIDYATGNIMRADSTEQPLIVDGKAVTLGTLADLTITQYDWAKKSDTSQKSTVTLPDGSGGAGLSNAQKRNLEMEKGDA